MHRTAVGTRRYAAPEILEGRRYSAEEGDIFSMGVILFLMVTGSMPSKEQASLDDPLYQNLCIGESKSFWKNFTTQSEPVQKETGSTWWVYQVFELLFDVLFGALFI
jgi:serine/threonine protein kinase